MIKKEFVFFKDARIVIVATVLLIITASGLHSAGTSGAAILKYNPGPRYQAMAGAGTASEEDFSATGWNPALLGTLKGLN
ncbi:MAG: hypothetical protein PF545_02435, partial [Elusimicrobia bacterium]|nr:hypothetical protein [Elusimicrobiota bacterium]